MKPSFIIARWEQTIRRWIPNACNPHHPKLRLADAHFRATRHRARIHPMASEFRADNTRLGGDLIGIKNSAFEKIQPAEKLYSLKRKKSVRQIREMEIDSPETALVSDMMDGQHGFERKSVCVNKNRHQRRCPIVHV